MITIHHRTKSHKNHKIIIRPPCSRHTLTRLAWSQANDPLIGGMLFNVLIRSQSDSIQLSQGLWLRRCDCILLSRDFGLAFPLSSLDLRTHCLFFRKTWPFGSKFSFFTPIYPLVRYRTSHVRLPNSKDFRRVLFS